MEKVSGLLKTCLFIPKGSFSHTVSFLRVKMLKSCELCRQSVTWKRYSDFKKLHKSMFSLHKALHRREQFPPFVKAQLFSE